MSKNMSKNSYNFFAKSFSFIYDFLSVWNIYTGTFEAAPMLFMHSPGQMEYKIIHLYFSDGTDVKVIYEHAFWDFNLNRYVFLREDASQYIGHWYNKQITDANGELAWTKVQLVNVVVQYEFTTPWSPVTYAHLCFYVNGMLSMPGNTEKLINIFQVNAETMQIDEEAFLADIETYGIFTYEEFAEVIPVSEIVFEAFSMQYYKIAIGKGLLDFETIGALVQVYAQFLEDLA